MVKTYDPASRKLAEYFLQDEPQEHRASRAHGLSLAIQEAVEDWLEDNPIEDEPVNREYA